ncbi:MAG: tyrosine decarboxylase MfnA [Candidatus Hodarchaeales archaeon]
MVNSNNTEKENIDLEYELSKDFSYSTGRVLSSMNTEADPIALKIFRENVHRNLGDPALFPGTSNIEKYVVKVIGKLFDLPKGGTGVILSGGSEANITALWAIRNSYINKNKSKSNEILNILAPQSVHVSVDKAANLLNLNLIKIPVNDYLQMDTDALIESINSRTIGIVGVAGTTALGTIDPLLEIDRICTENNLSLHVDAAFGGFVIPFLANKDIYNLTFKLKSLVSIAVDLHKMGRVPINGGGLLWRDKALPEAIKFSLPYLVGSPSQVTLTGTRSGAAAIAFATLWQKIGFIGYQKIVNECIENTNFLAKELLKMGFNIPVKPIINIIGVKPPEHSSISLKELHELLWQNGWNTSIVDGLLRLVIMPATKRHHLEEFLQIIDSVISNNL